MNAVATLRLKPNRHFPFLNRHPWVRAHSIAEHVVGPTGEDATPGKPAMSVALGDVVDVTDSRGVFVGRGLVNPHGKLRVRLYSFDASVAVDGGLFCRAIDAAVARRRLVNPASPQSGERLVFSESDLISGLIVDRYANHLSVSMTSLALSRYADAIIDHLKQTIAPEGMVRRFDEKTYRLEGGEAAGVPIETLRGTIGSIPTDGVPYQSGGLTYRVDLTGGQKTGGYLDQRDNHAAAARYMAGRRVLDVCCYHGGFALAAAAAGAASVTGLDASRSALEVADAAAAENGLEVDFIQGDCFDVLSDMAGGGQSYDAVILDPPRLAGSAASVEAAMRAYHRLNASAVALLPAGGILVTCSCSGRVSETDFLKMLSDVGRRTGRDLVVMEFRGAAADHPVAVACPESRYLKCAIVSVGPARPSGNFG